MLARWPKKRAGKLERSCRRPVSRFKKYRCVILPVVFVLLAASRDPDGPGLRLRVAHTG